MGWTWELPDPPPLAQQDDGNPARAAEARTTGMLMTAGLHRSGWPLASCQLDSEGSLHMPLAMLIVWKVGTAQAACCAGTAVLACDSEGLISKGRRWAKGSARWQGAACIMGGPSRVERIEIKIEITPWNAKPAPHRYSESQIHGWGLASSSVLECIRRLSSWYKTEDRRAF